MSLHLKPGQLTLADLRQAYLAPVRLSLDPSADAPVAASVACVENIIAEGRTAYGINTGFGLLASTRISPADLEKLQRSIVLSHAAGVGEALDDAMVRLVMLLKVNSLARGFSGIRRKVIDALIALINAEVYPHIPLKGSVGASGDLAPLAHMSLVLIGESRARHRGEWLPAAEALAVAGLEPLTLAAKEGLALLNGTQVSTAYALRGLFEAEDLFAAATVCGGLSVEAMLGSRAPFDARIHAARGQRGQIDVAAAYRDLLTASSEVARSHEKCDKVQDPYSLRCQPQVMGACLTQMRQAAEVLEIEANAVSDFAEELGASTLAAHYSRYVVDLNRPSDDKPLYSTATTGLYPDTLFDGRPLYREGMAPSAEERMRYLAEVWTPYHRTIAEELARLKAEFGYALLWDAHSIRSHVPHLFDGRLPDFNLGTNAGASCDPALAARLEAVCAAAEGYSHVLNGRFKGGHITRHYGQPEQHVHAVQLELAQCTYMDEQAPFAYRADLAEATRAVIRELLESLLAWGHERYA
ncbi:N-formylglutamate deformylase [Pseudomonas aeruginosa]